MLYLQNTFAGIDSSFYPLAGVAYALFASPRQTVNVRFWDLFSDFDMPRVEVRPREDVAGCREQLYVAAARVSGMSRTYIITRHVLPRIMGPIVVQASLLACAALLVESGLNYLGLGVQPPTPDLGSMVADGARYLPDAWWLTVFPGLAILVAVFGFNLLGDAMREVLGAEQ